jgi:thioredoxin 1
MDSLADQYAGKIKFVKVNVDESPKLAQKFQVEGIPKLVFLQHGKTAGTSVGLVAKEDLILRLDSLLQTNAQPAATGR